MYGGDIHCVNTVKRNIEKKEKNETGRERVVAHAVLAGSQCRSYYPISCQVTISVDSSCQSCFLRSDWL